MNQQPQSTPSIWSKLVPHAVWFLAVVAAFLLGSLRSNRDTFGEEKLAGSMSRSGGTVLGGATRGIENEGDQTNTADSKARIAFGSKHPLTEADIRALGDRIRNERDPIGRRMAFARLLDGLTVENAKLVRQQIAHLREDSGEFREFHYAWGRIGGVDAVMNGTDTPKRDMEATIAGWASADPSEALKWFEALESSSKDNYANKEYLKMGMLHGLANADPEMATEFAFQRASQGDKRAEEMLGVVARKLLGTDGAQAAAAWAEALPEGHLRSGALGRVAHEYARENPEAAATWAVSHLDEDSGGRVVQGVTSQWARRDGPGAVAWLDSLEAGSKTAGAYRQAFEGWAGQDPRAASEHLVNMEQSTQRDYAIGGLVNRHRWEDPLAAIAWAGQVEEPRVRQAATYAAAEAYLRRDPQAAREWLPSSGLSEQAQDKLLSPRKR